jgi:cysteine desulfuration protein SufE
MSIEQRQQDLIEQFQMLDGDMEMTLHYIMELGNELEAMEENEKTEDRIVKGCQSKVWLHAEKDNGHVHFSADSNTAITKGLVSMLLKVVNDLPAKDILDANFFFPEKIGMNRFIGTQRSNGFAAMIKQIKYYALALSQKQESHG